MVFLNFIPGILNIILDRKYCKGNSGNFNIDALHYSLIKSRFSCVLNQLNLNWLINTPTCQTARSSTATDDNEVTNVYPIFC